MNTLRLVLRSGMLLFMTVILLCTGSLAVGAAYPLWDLLVFSQLIGGQNDLFLADSTGRVVNLTRTPRASEVHPAWSPDGNSIAYISNATFNEELYIMQLADGTAEQITRTNRSHALPSWAPDGSAIAVAFLTSYAMNQSDVFTLDLTTGERRNLTEVGVSNVIAGTLPKWSPNGEYVAFINEGQQSVHVAQLPYGEIVAQSTSDTFAPAWAPDGTRLVYVGPRTRFTASTPDTLYVRDVTIPDEIPLGFSQDMQRILSPVWSPDGTQIAFIGEPFDRFTEFGLRRSGTWTSTYSM